MGANLTTVRTWTDAQRAVRLTNFTKVVKEQIAKAVPNLINEYEKADFLVMADALNEAIAEESVLKEATVTKAVYDAYVAAHP